MTAPRGIILIAVMLALCVLTLVVLPMLAVPQTRAVKEPDGAAMLQWRLESCRQKITRAVRVSDLQGTQLEALPGVPCTLIDHPPGGPSSPRVIEMRVESEQGLRRASALWVFGHGPELRIHEHPLVW